eukprot:CAMPEP_0204436426 /NCGR_PEP_ID=MMETSP0470-20130426/75459_1 /ASSEMBLY_ACC=CAM_ASM_000385 /TAXON_ID=2969 /ORGANISM="Oxyrrhis marina" /LENGTH=271 /DNA_ID=CAMNT_0051435081 /DNA_START=18 /DNA_END=830 /DNA_ORIENTATION=+
MTSRLRSATLCCGGALVADFCLRRCSLSVDLCRQSESRQAVQRPGTSWSEGAVWEQVATLMQTEEHWLNGGSTGGEAGLRDYVRSALGFSVRCASSDIVGGGDGLFALGNVPRGTMVSIYSGTHYSIWDRLCLHNFLRLLPRGQADEYVLVQADDSIMDGQSFTAEAQRISAGLVRPSACAQLANHPCSGVAANCGFLSITVPPCSEFAGLPVHSVRGGQTVHGSVITVLVSLCDIQDGAEITVDYEYGLGAPDWYSPSASPKSAPATLSL